MIFDVHQTIILNFFLLVFSSFLICSKVQNSQYVGQQDHINTAHYDLSI